MPAEKRHFYPELDSDNSPLHAAIAASGIPYTPWLNQSFLINPTNGEIHSDGVIRARMVDRGFIHPDGRVHADVGYLDVETISGVGKFDIASRDTYARIFGICNGLCRGRTELGFYAKTHQQALLRFPHDAGQMHGVHGITSLVTCSCYMKSRLEDARSRYREGIKFIDTITAQHRLVCPGGHWNQPGLARRVMGFIYDRWKTPSGTMEQMPLSLFRMYLQHVLPKLDICCWFGNDSATSLPYWDIFANATT